MMVVYQGSCGWWYVSLDKRELAKFLHKADAQIYAVCCYESGHATRVTLPSGTIL
jgi:hypothetical protein